MKNPSLEFDGVGGDYGLMEELAQHQPDALAKLYARYHALLRGVVLQIVRDDGDADDVLQEVFLQLWVKPECYCAAKGTPLGWLLTLSRRRAIDCLRRRNTYRRVADRFEILQRHASVQKKHSVERHASCSDLREYLAGLMSQLPPAQQSALEQGFFQQMSQRQIAAAMHLPLGTVKTRMELGLRKLTKMAAGCRAQID